MLLLLIFVLPMEITICDQCRWFNPVWLQSLHSGPYVSIDEKKIANISWNIKQFAKRYECVDRFDVSVKLGEKEKHLCSIDKREG